MVLGWRGTKEFNDHFAFFDKMFRTLKKQDNLNLDYTNFRKESELFIQYSDYCRYGFGRLDYILRKDKGKDFNNFLKLVAKYRIDEKTFMIVYTSCLTYLILLTYANIENMLLTILKGAKYGSKKGERINGNESLHILLEKIEKLYPPAKSLRSIIDVKFRNALAHGWYVVYNEGFIYYEDANLTKKHTLSIQHLFLKHIKLNILGMALTYLVLAMDY